MHDVLFHQTECHHEEQMASAATMLRHSILQNDVLLLSGKGYWFSVCFLLAQLLWLQHHHHSLLNTLRRYRRFMPGPSIMRDLLFALENNPWHPSWFYSLKRNLAFLSFFLFHIERSTYEKALHMELRWLGYTGCGRKARPAGADPSFTPRHQWPQRSHHLTSLQPPLC